MQLNPMPSFPLVPAVDAGTLAVLPLPLDLGGRPGTGAGALWLGERLALADVASLIEVPFGIAPPLAADTPFGRLEPSLHVAAVTLQAWRAGYRPLWLFGDHGLSFGPVRAAAAHGGGVTAFILDAHFDRLETLLARLNRRCAIPNEVHQGNVATWIGRTPEVTQLVQIGIRQQLAESDLDPVPNAAVLTAAEINASPADAAAWVARYVRDARARGDRITLSIDADVLDPAVQPAVDHPSPGGLSPSVVLQLATLIADHACTVDFAELNPLRDRDEAGCRTELTTLTAVLAAVTPASGRASWLPILGRRPPSPLHAFGPYTHAIVRDGYWFEPGPVEHAILAGAQVDDLVTSISPTMLRDSVAAIRHAKAPPVVPAFSALVRSPLVASPVGERSVEETHVECAAVSPCRSRLAVAGWDGSVYVSDLCDHRAPVLRLAGHEAWVVGCAFAPAGLRLASVSDDRTLRIWDVAHAADPLICRGHQHWVKAVAWSGDGSRIATGGFDGTIGLWDGRTGGCLQMFRAHPDAIWSLAWFPHDERVVSCGERGLVRVWNANTGTHVRDCTGHVAAIERCRVTASGAVWSLSRAGRLLRHPDDSSDPDVEIDTGFEQTLDLSLLDDTDLLLVAGPTTIRVIDTAALTACADLVVGFSIAAIVAPEPRRIVAAGDGGQLSMFELAPTVA